MAPPLCHTNIGIVPNLLQCQHGCTGQMLSRRSILHIGILRGGHWARSLCAPDKMSGRASILAVWVLKGGTFGSFEPDVSDWSVITLRLNNSDGKVIKVGLLYSSSALGKVETRGGSHCWLPSHKWPLQHCMLSGIPCVPVSMGYGEPPLRAIANSNVTFICKRHFGDISESYFGPPF